MFSGLPVATAMFHGLANFTWLFFFSSAALNYAAGIFP